MAQITVRIPDEYKEFLDKKAVEEDRNLSWLVRKAIENYIHGCQVVQNVEEN